MLELNHQFRVVDVHARLQARTPGTRPISGEGLERELHQAGIVHAVVFAGPLPSLEGTEGYLRANNAVAREAVERPFVSFARISGARHPGVGPGSRIRNLRSGRAAWHTSPEDVEQYAYNDRYHGFTLDPGRDGLPDGEVLDALEAVDLPVLVHGGRSFPPDTVESTLLDRTFPVVLAHFGGHPLDRTLMGEALSLLDDHDNLYLDTSGVRYRTHLEQGIREHPDRIIFGSGAPSIHPNVAVMEVLTLDVPEDAMRRVFAKNLIRLAEGRSLEAALTGR